MTIRFRPSNDGEQRSNSPTGEVTRLQHGTEELTGAPPEALPEVAGRGVRNWSRWFLVVALPLGILAVFLIPPLQELDGTAHLLRIDQIAHGHLVAKLAPDGRALVTPGGCVEGFIDGHIARGMTPGPMHPADSLRAQPCTVGTVHDISNTALNTPVSYLPQLLGYRLGLAVGGINLAYFGARLAGLLAYLSLGWLALRLATRGRALLFVVALLPSSLELASVLSADSFTVGLALLIVALVIRLRSTAGRRARPWELGLLAVSLCLLAVSKNTYGPFALLTLALPSTLFRSARRRITYVGAILGSVVVMVALWSSLVVARVRVAFPAFKIDSIATRKWGAAHPLSFGASLVRGLWDPWVTAHSMPGYVEVLGLYRPRFALVYGVGDRAPLWLFGFVMALTVLALVVDARTAAAPQGPAPATGSIDDATRQAADGRWWTLALTALVALSCTVLVLAGVRLIANAVTARSTSWVQGRYFLPLAPLLAIPVVTFWRRGRRETVPWSWLVLAGSLLPLAWVAARAAVIFY